MIHILSGQLAASNLEQAFELDENLKGEILILQDNLSWGPLSADSEESASHDAIRSAWYKTLHPDTEEVCHDEQRILDCIGRALAEEEPVCFWMSPSAKDVCAYFWLLTLFKSHPGMLHVIAIQGLPFLNEKGQLFYPVSFDQIPPKEFVKTKRLLKEVTPAEYETDGDEWSRLMQEASMIRVFEGGKKIASKELNHYDYAIRFSLTAEFQKASRVVSESIKKCAQPGAESFIGWRIRQLAAENAFQVQGDLSKGFKDFELRKATEEVAVPEGQGLIV